TFDTIKQQLPPVETIDGFVSANQMAIAQLAIQYCDALVESTGLNTGLRDTFFGAGFGFTSDVDTAFAGGRKDQIVGALYDNIVAYRTSGGSETLANMPLEADVKAELIGPDPVVTGYPGNLYDRLYTTANCSTVTCDQVRTRAVVKALCTSVLGSAAMLIQ
ncbi:MAG: hypothetical protein KAU29_06795, partial [Gammaproteobacteria bacterium]|nr:hypothetical protein [Gammaproteobacteria bacterium]